MFLFPARRLWALPLNLVGIVLVSLDLVRRSLRDAPVPLALAAWVALGFWVISVLLPEQWIRARAGACVIMVLGGALAGAPTDVVAFVPAISGILNLVGTPAFPIRLATATGIAAGLVIWLSAVLFPAPPDSVIAVYSVLLICGLGGVSRRQYRISEAQSRALLEERVTVERERTQVAALTERSRIARDLHDVLAHSLGGLVIQLEAVDALLESGRSADARARVRAARVLAVSGFDEAKRAVSALREPSQPLSTIVADLVETHRALGGQVAARGDADRGTLPASGQTAVRRAVQELLTNARRHAPGAPTTLDLDWDDNMLTITASTPPGRFSLSEGMSSGGGHGLKGMRERVTEAGGTMTVRPGVPFEVTLRLPGEASA